MKFRFEPSYALPHSIIEVEERGASVLISIRTHPVFLDIQKYVRYAKSEIEAINIEREVENYNEVLKLDLLISELVELSSERLNGLTELQSRITDLINNPEITEGCIDGIGFHCTLENSKNLYFHSPSKDTRAFGMILLFLDFLKSCFKDKKVNNYLKKIESYYQYPY